MASENDLLTFHSEDYIQAIKSISQTDFDPEELEDIQTQYGLKDDCPYFPSLWNYARLITGSTILAARYLIQNRNKHAPVAINWMGGRHHAKKDEASGFCYINDVTIGVIQLLKCFERVLCLDIDIHHGDGVEESFYYSKNVLTVSFHMKEPGFFPGTGGIESIGGGKAKFYNWNIPLKEGIDDSQYVFLFQEITKLAMENYKPQCIVLVCGADVLKGDPLGGFNVTLSGIEKCIKFIKSYEKPTLVLGGGGYHWPNVTRLASITTAVFCDITLLDSIPIFDDNYKNRDTYFVPSSSVKNKNSEDYINHIIQTIEGYSKKM